MIRAEPIIEKCYYDYSNSMYIRLTALDTIREISCTSQYAFYTKLFSTFSDTDFDSELRIGAYLALMSCPSKTTVNLVKHVLTTEPVNQGECLHTVDYRLYFEHMENVITLKFES